MSPGSLERLPIATLAGLLLGVVACSPPVRPNVLLVVVDTLRRDRVSAYGEREGTTPFLERLARESTLYERAYSQAPHTSTSTAVLFTSRIAPLRSRGAAPSDAGASGEERIVWLPRLLEENLTLAEVFRDAGYQTSGFFTNPFHNPTSGFAQGFEHSPYLSSLEQRGSYAWGREVNRTVRDWLRKRDAERPFFAYVHYMDPHFPFRPSRAFQDRWVTESARVPYVQGIHETEALRGPEDLLTMKQLYDGEVAFTDSMLADLVAAAREASGETPLYVLIASDHGEEFMEHGGLGHGETTEPEQLRVPLLLHRSDAPQGRRSDVLVRNIDIGPMLLALASIAVPAGFEGSSAPALEEGAGAEVSLAWHGDLRAIVTDRWHLSLDRRSGSRRLYDVRQDPAGLHDVADENPEVVARLRLELDALDRQLAHSRERADALTGDAEPGSIDPALVEQLRGLGYVE